MEDEILIIDFEDDGGDFPAVEQYRLALESIYRWTWRTDELEPMDIIRAIKRVARVAMEAN